MDSAKLAEIKKRLAAAIKFPGARILYTATLEQHVFLDQAPADIAALLAAYEAKVKEVERLREVLDKLARLGAEPNYGTSTGNRIAQAALATNGVDGKGE